MISIDTNVLVRFFVVDDPDQAARARQLIENNKIFLSLTVCLETVWVLRSVFDHTYQRIYEGLRVFAGLPQVTVEYPERLAAALDLADGGMDFADALHCLAGGEEIAFATFDERLIRKARAAGLSGVRTP
ncbi:MAG: type II toxin-antitoxin system VapC family toxin [Salinarimonas sp.]